MNFVVLKVGWIISAGKLLYVQILWLTLENGVCTKFQVSSCIDICIPETSPPSPSQHLFSLTSGYPTSTGNYEF